MSSSAWTVSRPTRSLTRPAPLGFAVEPHRYVRETDTYLGATVVVLRRPIAESPGLMVL